jgi:HlyD family secretion protein
MIAHSARWPATRPLVTGFLTAGLVVGGIGTWSVLATISGAIMASGQVEVAENVQVAAHPEGGVVVEVLVAEGDAVVEGDVLLRLDGTDLRAELSVVESRLLELDAWQIRLQALRSGATDGDGAAALSKMALGNPAAADLIDGQAALLALQADEVRQAKVRAQARIRQIKLQIDGFDTQQEAFRTQIALLEAELATERRLLAQELTLAGRVSAMERDLAALRGRIGELLFARAEAMERIGTVELEVDALITGYQTEAETGLRDVAAGLQDLTARKDVLLARIARLDVRAPASGIVLGLKVTRPQAVIRPAEPLLSIVPQDRPLRVVLRVPTTEIEDLHPGQDLRLVFSSASAPNSSDLAGTIALISADALVDDRTGQTHYRVEVTMDAVQSGQLVDRELVPGMPVLAFIKTADRSPLAYLLRPFADYFRTAFRDG